MRTPIRTWKSNLILDKEQSDQELFGKLIINNQIGLVKVQKSIGSFHLPHLALIHVATSAITPIVQSEIQWTSFFIFKMSLMISFRTVILHMPNIQLHV